MPSEASNSAKAEPAEQQDDEAPRRNGLVHELLQRPELGRGQIGVDRPQRRANSESERGRWERRADRGIDRRVVARCGSADTFPGRRPAREPGGGRRPPHRPPAVRNQPASLADGVFTRPDAPRHRVVDHDDPLARRVVPRRQLAARADLDTHRLHIVVADDANEGDRRLTPRVACPFAPTPQLRFLPSGSASVRAAASMPGTALARRSTSSK